MNNYNIIETVAASAGDIVLTGNGQLAITGAPTIPLKLSRLGARRAAAAGVASVKVITLATTVVAGTRYAFTCSQEVDGQTVSRIISVTATSTSTAVVSAAMKTQLDNFGFEFASVVLSGTNDSVITITGAAGYETFTLANIANTTPSTTTPGNRAVGLGSVLLAQGLTGFTPANFYDAYPIEIGQELILDGGSRTQKATTPYTVYVNIGTNAGSPSATSALVAIGYSNVARGFIVNAGVAVPTQAATAAAIAAATGDATIKAAVAPLAQIGVDVYNQRTSG
jgi:hypothetical protein